MNVSDALMGIFGFVKVEDDYPDWICADCGDMYGKRKPIVATFHIGDKCGWCGRETEPVTQPRDYGYPEFVRE